ncbi:putative quinol monooxygenase [Patulibacter sp.]|uniref:putative quinol monooxygenase n=1 Tax=Patulibacter sp. TaxID=1912859 RepID=UPI002717CFBE|nr:putative quinol monooxygenase [Patulibacter sp.]MDO9409795.1 putative quinol monooxygenase [Patulibacter sp.]
MSLVVIAHIRAKEGQEAAVEEALSALVLASHDEEGCIAYALHRNVEDPRDFSTVEQWASPEAIGAHFETDHLKAVLARAEELLDGAPDIRTYSAIPVGGDKGAL